MRRTIPRASGVIAVALAALLVGFGCATTSETDEPVEETPSDTGSDFQAMEETPPTTPVVARAAISPETVYFAFDKYALDPQARQTAQANGSEIKQAGAGILLEGNTDERGTEEYNFALGERRANAVKKYLMDLGISASDLRTVSYGETSPAVEGHNESAWRYNRRVDFRVTR